MARAWERARQYLHGPAWPALDGDGVRHEGEDTLAPGPAPRPPAAPGPVGRLHHQTNRQRLDTTLAAQGLRRNLVAGMAVGPAQMQWSGERPHSSLLREYGELVGIVRRPQLQQCCR